MKEKEAREQARMVLEEGLVAQQQYLAKVQSFLKTLEERGFQTPQELWGLAGYITGTIAGYQEWLKKLSSK